MGYIIEGMWVFSSVVGANVHRIAPAIDGTQSHIEECRSTSLSLDQLLAQ